MYMKPTVLEHFRCEKSKDYHHLKIISTQFTLGRDLQTVLSCLRYGFFYKPFFINAAL